MMNFGPVKEKRIRAFNTLADLLAIPPIADDSVILFMGRDTFNDGFSQIVAFDPDDTTPPSGSGPYEVPGYSGRYRVIVDAVTVNSLSTIIVGSFGRITSPADLPVDGLIPANFDGPGIPAAPYQMQLGQSLVYLLPPDGTGDGHLWTYVSTVYQPSGWLDAGLIQGPPGPPGPAASDHATLVNRDTVDQHPILAITGLIGSLADGINHNTHLNRGDANSHPTSAITGLDASLTAGLDHSVHLNRNLPDQHPTSAITNLDAGLADGVDHSTHINRDAADSHPTSAITGLDTAIASIATGDALRVLKAGDTMTGNLTFNGAATVVVAGASIDIQGDGQGVNVFGGGKFYKAVGDGVRIRKSSGNQQPTIEDNAGTNVRKIVDQLNTSFVTNNVTATTVNYYILNATGQHFIVRSNLAENVASSQRILAYESSNANHVASVVAAKDGVVVSGNAQATLSFYISAGGYGDNRLALSFKVDSPPTTYCEGTLSAADVVDRSVLATKTNVAPLDMESASAIFNALTPIFYERIIPASEGQTIPSPPFLRLGFSVEDLDAVSPELRSRIVKGNGNDRALSIPGLLAVAVAEIRRQSGEMMILRERLFQTEIALGLRKAPPEKPSLLAKLIRRFIK
jgi:hypothetical protein